MEENKEIAVSGDSELLDLFTKEEDRDGTDLLAMSDFFEVFIRKMKTVIARDTSWEVLHNAEGFIGEIATAIKGGFDISRMGILIADHTHFSQDISRAGVYLKPVLVEGAHAAVKATQKSSYFKIKYEHIMKRRSKKRAIIAIARMMLTAVFAMLKSGEVFNPCDLHKYDMPEELRRKQTLASAKDAVKLLVSLGVVPEGSISLEPLAG